MRDGMCISEAFATSLAYVVDINNSRQHSVSRIQLL